jgi:hypothetical protein
MGQTGYNRIEREKLAGMRWVGEWVCAVTYGIRRRYLIEYQTVNEDGNAFASQERLNNISVGDISFSSSREIDPGADGRAALPDRRLQS